MSEVNGRAILNSRSGNMPPAENAPNTGNNQAESSLISSGASGSLGHADETTLTECKLSAALELDKNTRTDSETRMHRICLMPSEDDTDSYVDSVSDVFEFKENFHRKSSKDLEKFPVGGDFTMTTQAQNIDPYTFFTQLGINAGKTSPLSNTSCTTMKQGGDAAPPNCLDSSLSSLCSFDERVFACSLQVLEQKIRQMQTSSGCASDKATD